jgi:hypothetical protein
MMDQGPGVSTTLKGTVTVMYWPRKGAAVMSWS